MDLYNKLKGIPTIYYFNSDEKTSLKEHMERGFLNVKVEDFKRVSTSKYTKVNISDWKDLLLDRKNYKLPAVTAGYSITILETLKNWYNNTEEDTVIISRDTIDFGVYQYWNFDWKYFMTRIPYDWDAVLLGFENINYIPFYLHQIMPAHTFGIAMLNRRYVRKLIRLHCVGDQYKLTNYIANKNFGFHSGTPDYFIGHCGKTYCLPMFPNHTDFFDKSTKKYAITKACRLAYYDWWRNNSKKHSFDELFTYGKGNDNGMIKSIGRYFGTNELK